MDRLQEIVNRFRVSVAIITVPEISAQEVCNDLLKTGISGIVNFSPVLLKVPGNIIVNNVNLSDEVESVIWSVHKQAKEESTL